MDLMDAVSMRVQPVEEKIGELEAKIEKMRCFIWEHVLEKACSYRKRYPDGDWGGCSNDSAECSGGLINRCGMDTCPVLHGELW